MDKKKHKMGIPAFCPDFFVHWPFEIMVGTGANVTFILSQ